MLWWLGWTLHLCLLYEQSMPQVMHQPKDDERHLGQSSTQLHLGTKGNVSSAESSLYHPNSSQLADPWTKISETSFRYFGIFS